jgi:uncharacterized protein YacL
MINQLKNPKLTLLLRQLVTCAAFGIIGLTLSAITVHWFVNELVIEQTTLVIVAMYIGMFAGICVGGYTFLKKVGRQRESIRFILQGVIGLVIGLAISWKFMVTDKVILPRMINMFVFFLSPIAGLWLGFNYNLVNKKKNGRYTKEISETQDTE